MSWLIYSGTHGDEAGVIPLLKDYLEIYKKELPDFVWVPEVSPSAVRLGTRRNERGADVNRIFSETSNDPEVVAQREFLRGKTFDVFIDFHEDPTTDAFYLYDSRDMRGTKEHKDLFAAVKNLGVPLYQGLDDEDMGWNVADGYIVADNTDTAPGFPPRDTSWKYLREQGIVRGRLLNPEIPGKATIAIKKKLIEQIFAFVK